MRTDPTRVLVTGATGFVGGALLRALRARPGVEVRGLGRRQTADPDIAAVDLSRPVVPPFGPDFRPDVIVHAAARTSQWGTRAEFRAQNVDATANVLDLARRSGLPRVVYVSSTSVSTAPPTSSASRSRRRSGPDSSMSTRAPSTRASGSSASTRESGSSRGPVRSSAPATRRCCRVSSRRLPQAGSRSSAT